jgi:hypothetical protein
MFICRKILWQSSVSSQPNPQVAPGYRRQWRLRPPALDQRQPHELTTHIAKQPQCRHVDVDMQRVLTGSAPPGVRTTCRPRARAEAPPRPLQPPPPARRPTWTTAKKDLSGTVTAPAPAVGRSGVRTSRRLLHNRFAAVSGVTTTTAKASPGTGRSRASARS